MENGRTLTLYILHCGNDARHHPDESVASVLSDEMKVSVVPLLGQFDFSVLFPDTKWKMFIYSDERLSKSVRQVLPLFLDSDYESISMFKVNKDHPNGSVFLISRLFKSGVVLKPDSIFPVGKCSNTNILDGFLFGGCE
jgi:hypothetical protein